MSIKVAVTITAVVELHGDMFPTALTPEEIADQYKKRLEDGDTELLYDADTMKVEVKVND